VTVDLRFIFLSCFIVKTVLSSVLKLGHSSTKWEGRCYLHLNIIGLCVRKLPQEKFFPNVITR
jgi:hypothetical protein